MSHSLLRLFSRLPGRQKHAWRMNSQQSIGALYSARLQIITRHLQAGSARQRCSLHPLAGLHPSAYCRPSAGANGLRTLQSRAVAGGASRLLGNPPVLAFIADVESHNGKALQPLFADLDSKGVKYIISNDLAGFTASPLLSKVEVIVPVGFADGKMSLITDLWPLCAKVKWVHSMAAGVEGVVPLLNALPGGSEIPLTNAKGAFSRSLAEYALLAMLHFNKQVPRLQDQKTARLWNKFVMGELFGKTVGFVGFGDIAQATARLCKPFGMKILALRQSRGAIGNELADITFHTGLGVGKEGDQKLEVFKQADFVVCSLPGGAATRHFCSKAEFAAMKSTGFFISLGRGTCVDEAALVEAIKSSIIGGAALDVFETEPLPTDALVWDCPNLLLSPHNADLIDTYMKDASDVLMRRLTEYCQTNFTGFTTTVDKVKGY